MRFRIEVDFDETMIGECDCSICTKKGILHLPIARERLEILSGADDIATYTFNTGVAKHNFCAGIAASMRSTSRARTPRITASTRAASTITIPM